MTIQIDINSAERPDDYYAHEKWLNLRVPVELKSRIGVPPVDVDGVLNDQYAVILE